MSDRIIEPWDSKYTNRQLFLNQMNYKDFDRSFNMEFGYWPEIFDSWSCFKSNSIRSWGHAYYMLGIDSIDALSGENFMYPHFEKKVLEDDGLHQIIMDEDGLTSEIFKDGTQTIPRFLKASVETPDDWKRLKEERFRLDDPARRVNIEALKKLHAPGSERAYPLGVWTGSMIGKIRDLLTFEGLCYAVYDYPDMVEDMVETSCRMVEHSLDQLLPEFQFDYACGWEDIAFKNGPIVSPDFFKAVIAPRYKRIHKKLEAHGVTVWYIDCDGDARPLIPTLLDSGVNTLFPYEVNSMGHPRDVLSEYGGQLRIMGGFDKMKLMEGRDAIKEYMKSLVPLVKKGGFIPFCDHLCPPGVSEENYLYYLDLKRRMFTNI